MSWSPTSGSVIRSKRDVVADDRDQRDQRDADELHARPHARCTSSTSPSAATRERAEQDAQVRALEVEEERGRDEDRGDDRDAAGARDEAGVDARAVLVARLRPRRQPCGQRRQAEDDHERREEAPHRVALEQESVQRVPEGHAGGYSSGGRC